MAEVSVFTADWYPGDSRLRELVDEVNESLPGDGIRVVDVDECFQEAEERLVLALPTVIVEKQGKESKRVVGAVDAGELKVLAKVLRNQKPAR